MSDNDKTSKIDAAIAAAKLRAEKREKRGASDNEGELVAVERPKRVKLTEDERKARQEQILKDRQERKEKREQERAEKRAQKQSDQKPSHLTKVLKAKAALPALSETLETEFNTITAGFSAEEINLLISHLQIHTRQGQTLQAKGRSVNVGDEVRIVGGDPRWVGKVGVVDQAARIRCFVNFPLTRGDGTEYQKRVYLFTSDVEVTVPAVGSSHAELTEQTEDVAETGTDG